MTPSQGARTHFIAQDPLHPGAACGCSMGTPFVMAGGGCQQLQHFGAMQTMTDGWQRQQTTACSEICTRRLRGRAKRQRRSCSGRWSRTAGALNRNPCLRLGAGPVMKRSSHRLCQEQILVKGVGACCFGSLCRNLCCACLQPCQA